MEGDIYYREPFPSLGLVLALPSWKLYVGAWGGPESIEKWAWKGLPESHLAQRCLVSHTGIKPATWVLLAPRLGAGRDARVQALLSSETGRWLPSAGLSASQTGPALRGSTPPRDGVGPGFGKRGCRTSTLQCRHGGTPSTQPPPPLPFHLI